MRRSLVSSACLLLLFGCGARPTPAPARPSVAALDWLVGTWATDDGTIERWWHDGDALAGEGASTEPCPEGAPATCTPSRTVTESLRIEARADGLVYVATPVGAGPTEFPVVEAGSSTLVAENLAHDFPQRLHYALEAGTLHVDVSGNGLGTALTMHRAAH